MAHELGTPLSVVDGTAQRLARSGGTAPEPLEAIRSAVGRMEGIVRRLLEFGVSAAGEPERRDASSLLVSAAGALRGEAESQEVALEVEVGEEAPEVRVDARRVESALVHLLRNAVQAAAPGGTVVGRVVATEGHVDLVVDDDGPGVPDSVGDRLFEPFFTTKAEGEGSGLGLAVV
ncbi:MAG: sensor histidine kinase, partial [Gemmatimonadota bacterium]